MIRTALSDAAGRLWVDLERPSRAEAQEILATRGAADLAELQAADFTPEAARTLDAAQVRAEAEGLLVAAAEDGIAMAPRIEELLANVEGLKARAAGGDWSAEANLSGVMKGSEDMLWKLKAFAALNGGG